MSAYAVGLRLIMLQIYLYQYWTWPKRQEEGRTAPRPCNCTVYNCTCVFLIIIIIIIFWTAKYPLWIYNARTQIQRVILYSKTGLKRSFWSIRQTTSESKIYIVYLKALIRTFHTSFIQRTRTQIQKVICTQKPIF